MRSLRPTRLPIIIAWLVIIGVVSWIGTHPKLIAPYASQIVSRHLLQLDGSGLRVRDYDIRPFEGMDLFGVTLTLPAASGGMTLIAADTVRVDFVIGEVLAPTMKFRRVEVSRPEVFSRAGSDTTDTEPLQLDLPKMLIEHLVIDSAYLEFSKSNGRLAERISHLNWSGGVRSDENIQLILRGCDVTWDTHQSVLKKLRGDIVIDNNQLELQRLYGQLNDKNVDVSGTRTWDGDLAINVKANGVSIPEVENLIDQSLGFAAAGDIDALIASRGDTIFFDGGFSGELEGYDIRGLTGSAVIANDEVHLNNLKGNINGATFDGSGLFDIASSDSISFVLEGQVSDVDLARGLIPDEEDMPETSGTGHLRIEHTDIPLWTGVSGLLTNGNIDIIPFDTCYVDVEAFADSVLFNRIELLYNDLHALLDGSSDREKIFRGDLSVTSENLQTLPASWLWPPLSGRMYGQGAVLGPLTNLNFKGWTSIFDFSISSLGASYSEVDLNIDDVLGQPVFSAGIDGQGLSLDDVPFGDFELWGATSTTTARIDTFRSVLGDTSVTFSMSADFSDSVFTFNIPQFVIGLEGTHWRTDAPVNLGIGAGYFDLSSLKLESDQGVLFAAGHYQDGVNIDGNLKMTNFDLGLLDPFVQSDQPLSGRITADARVGVGPDNNPNYPQVDLVADMTGATFALADIDSLHMKANFWRGTVDISEFDLRSNYGAVRAQGTVAHSGVGIRDFWPGANLDLTLEIPDGDWAFVDQFAIPALDRLAGRFSGSLEIAGQTTDPLIEGQIHSTPFHIHWLHLDELTGYIWADKGQFVLGNLQGNKDDMSLIGRIEVPVELDLLSEPVSPPDGPFYMQLEIPEGTNLEPMSRATNAFVTSSGTGAAKVTISGPLDHPSYQGYVNIEDAGFILRDLQEIYSETNCEGLFQGDELLIRNIEGHEGLRGKFDGQGTVLFKGLELETFRLGLNLDRFLVASVPDMAAVVSGRNARLTGVKVGPDSLLVPHFSGELEIMKARYTGDFSEKGGGNDPLAATVSPDWLADLHLHGAPRTSRIINRDMELWLGGDMDLVRDEQGLYLRGSLDVNAGRMIVFNNNFEVERGRLDFSREIGFAPRMDVEAGINYRLRSQYSSNSILEHIGVHVTGTIFRPEIAFTSERGYSREAIQRMLLGLEPHATAQGDASRLRASSLTAGYNILEREIARELDIFDTFEIDQIQRQNEAGDTGLDPLIGVGKYIGSDLYLKYAQGVRMDDRDFLVEYQINEHLLLQSEVRRRFDENQGDPTYNLDLKYRFEY